MSTAAPLPLSQTLDELEAVLRDERLALTQLDREAIASAAEKKLRLDEALRLHLSQASATPELVARVEQLQKTAKLNQLLLVHARSCVHGMLQMLTGRTESPLPRSGAAAPLPVALNVRG